MIITLTTDFGTRDGFVGAMKGVIASRAPDVTIVDITHDIPRHDIAHAAWAIAMAAPEFPPNTIHVVVVDPGVGGERAPVIVQIGGMRYVAPDNGVLMHLGAGPGYIDAREIRFPRFMAERVSPTFHGRDVFAVAAAMLARGEQPHHAGPYRTLSGVLPWGEREAGHGRVVHVDSFGNLISDLPAHEAGAAIVVAERTLPIVRTYSDVEVGALLAYVGSAGTIEIAVREGSALERLALERGAPVMPATTTTTGPYR